MAQDRDACQPSPDAVPAKPAAKLPYEPPTVTRLGSVAELTQSGGLTKEDLMGQRQRIN
jgi:hypothetical protein